MKKSNFHKTNRTFAPSVLLLFFFTFALISHYTIDLDVNWENNSSTTVYENETLYITNSPLKSESSTLNLNRYALNSSLPKDITLNRETVYNISLTNMGDADFDCSLVVALRTINYNSQTIDSTYDDEVLTVAGVPWWGDYNTWDTISYSSTVSAGIQLNKGLQRSFLLYLGNALLPELGNPISFTFLVILQSTSNPDNNTLTINWTAISEAPSYEVAFSNSNLNNEVKVPANGILYANFTTENHIDLTNKVLNQSITTNNTNVHLIRWIKDLSGNYVRSTVIVANSAATLYVPSFSNILLDGTVSIGIFINLNETDNADINWTFSLISDVTIDSQSQTFENSSFEFKIGMGNKIWRTINLSNPSYFDIDFYSKNPDYLENWDISVEFYALGQINGLLGNLNSWGVNVSESATFFYTSQNNVFENTKDSVMTNGFLSGHYWWANHGVLNPVVNDKTGSNYFGMIILASPTTTIQNFNCSIDISVHPILDLNSNNSIEIGSENGYAFENRDIFQIRQFSFENFTQYQWGLQSRNTTVLNTYSKLYCNNIDTSLYPNDLNNTIRSIPINTAGLRGTIFLEFNLAGSLKTNDFFYVYILNSSGLSPAIVTYSSNLTSGSKSLDITKYNDTQIQIVFRMKTSSTSVDVGPIIDDVVIKNASSIVFSDNFENDFNRWIQMDNQSYWRIDRDYQSYNFPVMNIIYPNSLYSMMGYPADGISYSDFEKVALNYTPYVQLGNIGYVVIEPDNTLIQNFTAIINQTKYQSIALTNSTLIKSNYNYPQLVSQNGIFWEETVSIPDFYSYYYLDMEMNHVYSISLRMENDPTVLLNCDLLNQEGRVWTSSLFDNYYGFFIVNNTYNSQSDVTNRLYFKFDAISYGKEISVLILDFIPPPVPILYIPSIPIFQTPDLISEPNLIIPILWSPVYQADLYRIYINGVLDSNVSTNQFNFSRSEFGNFNITVSAVNQLGESNQSEAIEIRIRSPEEYENLQNDLNSWMITGISFGVALVGMIAVNIKRMRNAKIKGRNKILNANKSDKNQI